MGIHGLLPLLPGGKSYLHSFFASFLRSQEQVPFDAAGALWQFAAMHAADHLRGNHEPALGEFARFINYLRSICQWKLVVYMDGRENVHKAHENKRRQQRCAKAQEERNLRGQIRNSPEYIAKAIAVCKFMRVEVVTAAYESDTQ